MPAEKGSVTPSTAAATTAASTAFPPSRSVVDGRLGGDALDARGGAASASRRRRTRARADVGRGARPEDKRRQRRRDRRAASGSGFRSREPCEPDSLAGAPITMPSSKTRSGTQKGHPVRCPSVAPMPSARRVCAQRVPTTVWPRVEPPYEIEVLWYRIWYRPHRISASPNVPRSGSPSRFVPRRIAPPRTPKPGVAGSSPVAPVP